MALHTFDVPVAPPLPPRRSSPIPLKVDTVAPARGQPGALRCTLSPGALHRLTIIDRVRRPLPKRVLGLRLGMEARMAARMATAGKTRGWIPSLLLEYNQAR
jgi:hypothetical protein